MYFSPGNAVCRMLLLFHSTVDNSVLWQYENKLIQMKYSTYFKKKTKTQDPSFYPLFSLKVHFSPSSILFVFSSFLPCVLLLLSPDKCFYLRLFLGCFPMVYLQRGKQTGNKSSVWVLDFWLCFLKEQRKDFDILGLFCRSWLRSFEADIKYPRGYFISSEGSELQQHGDRCWDTSSGWSNRSSLWNRFYARVLSKKKVKWDKLVKNELSF